MKTLINRKWYDTETATRKKSITYNDEISNTRFYCTLYETLEGEYFMFLGQTQKITLEANKKGVKIIEEKYIQWNITLVSDEFVKDWEEEYKYKTRVLKFSMTELC